MHQTTSPVGINLDFAVVFLVLGGFLFLIALVVMLVLLLNRKTRKVGLGIITVGGLLVFVAGLLLVPMLLLGRAQSQRARMARDLARQQEQKVMSDYLEARAKEQRIVLDENPDAIDVPHEASGGEASGGEPSDDEASDGEPSGGEASGGEASDGEPSGGEPSDDEASDGEPSGGEASGGEASDGEPSGGEPSDDEPSDDEPSEGEASEGEPSEGEPSDDAAPNPSPMAAEVTDSAELDAVSGGPSQPEFGGEDTSGREDAASSSSAETMRPTLPDWVESEPVREGDLHTQVVSCGPYLSHRECFKRLNDDVMNTTLEYVRWYLAESHGVKPNARQLRHLATQPVVYDLEANSHHEIREFEGLGTMHTQYLLLQFDRDFRTRVDQLWQEAQTAERLTGTAFASGGVLALLAAMFGYFKTDSVTRGQYRGQLRLATGAAILALVGTCAWLIGWFPLQ